MRYAQAFKPHQRIKRRRFLKRAYLAKQAKQPMVYVDETGFSPTTHRQYGWGKRGQRVYGLQNANQRPRTSLIGGYLNHQWIAPMLFEGTCNTEVFNQWLLHMLLLGLVTGSVIVMDNAAFHKSAETIEIIEDACCGGFCAHVNLVS